MKIAAQIVHEAAHGSRPTRAPSSPGTHSIAQ
jgi:hypothetical protein